MSLFKSGNPTLQPKRFEQQLGTVGESMTVRGTLTKFGFLAAMVMASAVYTWTAATSGKEVGSWIMIGAISGLVLALVITFRPHWSPFLAPAYGLAEGVVLGGISAVYSAAFDNYGTGLITQAVGLTFAVVISMYILYQLNILRATPLFKKVIIIATAGIAIFYLLTWVLGFFNIQMPYIHGNGLIGIGFSLFVVAIAALNLILDFDQIEQGTAMGAPKFMEWYAAFGLAVTIIWLYLEMLRLLSKLSSRD